jgi:hypothetical protein
VMSSQQHPFKGCGNLAILKANRNLAYYLTHSYFCQKGFHHVCHFFFSQKNHKPLVPSSGLEHQRVVQRWMVPETRKGEVKKVGGGVCWALVLWPIGTPNISQCVLTCTWNCLSSICPSTNFLFERTTYLISPSSNSQENLAPAFRKELATSNRSLTFAMKNNRCLLKNCIVAYSRSSILYKLFWGSW